MNSPLIRFLDPGCLPVFLRLFRLSRQHLFHCTQKQLPIEQTETGILDMRGRFWLRCDDVMRIVISALNNLYLRDLNKVISTDRIQPASSICPLRLRGI
jgi:hypothetical protein